MEARLNLFETQFGAKFFKALATAGRVSAGSTLPRSTVELVLLRASQINGCSMCVDMHTKDAIEEGETVQRLFLVSAWREAKVFTEAERAALELAEEGTRVADGAGGVPDAVWENARKHYDDEQLAALIATIGMINLYNRMNIITQLPAGDYVPGMFG